MPRREMGAEMPVRIRRHGVGLHFRSPCSLQSGRSPFYFGSPYQYPPRLDGGQATAQGHRQIDGSLVQIQPHGSKHACREPEQGCKCVKAPVVDLSRYKGEGEYGDGIQMVSTDPRVR